MKKIYHLASCSTCVRIIKELNLPEETVLQNIKEEAISTEQLAEMAHLAGSYEALFSRRAMKYKSLGLAQKTLTESDYKALILEEYTFLKRPVLIINEQIFIGNAAKTVEQAKQALQKS